MLHNLKISFIFFLTIFFINSPDFPAPNTNSIHTVNIELKSSLKYVPVPFTVKDFVGFKNFLGFFESGSNYNKINRYGYMGKYQFGEGTLRLEVLMQL